MFRKTASKRLSRRPACLPIDLPSFRAGAAIRTRTTPYGSPAALNPVPVPYRQYGHVITPTYSVRPNQDANRQHAGIDCVQNFQSLLLETTTTPLLPHLRFTAPSHAQECKIIHRHNAGHSPVSLTQERVPVRSLCICQRTTPVGSARRPRIERGKTPCDARLFSSQKMNKIQT